MRKSQYSLFSVAGGTVAVMLWGSTAVMAHAHLVRATPAVGGTVQETPKELVLRFNEKLESSFSTVVVRDATGNQVEKVEPQVDKGDRFVLRAALPTLSPGVYKVEWHVMSTDTHKVNGNFTFTVGQ
jgi:copper resistance protein C